MFKKLALGIAETAISVTACLVVSHYVGIAFDKVRERVTE